MYARDALSDATVAQWTSRRRIVLAAVVVGLALALGWALTNSSWGSERNAALTASGTVEADEIALSAQVTGRIARISIDEGEPVREGRLVAQLDDSLLRRQYEQADAAQRRLLQIQIEQSSVFAPSDGVILKKVMHEGEVATAGLTILTMAQLNRLDLTLYVLERDLGRVRLGQTVAISADSYPGRRFEGRVASIGDKAEFTPRNVQTQRDRLNLVFPVKVRVDNSGLLLKPGMPVDARFEA